MAGLVVLVVDRWGAAWCGPYGNTFVETPSLDRLASQSLLYDWVLAESPELAAIYQALWSARHPLLLGHAADLMLPARVEQAQRSSWLLSDEPEVFDFPGSEIFQRLIRLESSRVESLAEDLSQTRLAEIFAEASRLIVDPQGPWLLWVHAQGMHQVWDAPWSARLRFQEDQDDPEPSRSPAPPRLGIQEAKDPDVVFQAAQGYAAQVEIADACLGGLLDQLDEMEQPPWLVFLSPRGYPLGEHGRVGPGDESLYGELLQAPLLIRPPAGLAPGQRRSDLLQWAELGEWLGQLASAPLDADGLATSITDGPRGKPWSLATTEAGEQTALRTQHWFARQAGDELELFAKPDDRFEANDVRRRCPEVAEAMSLATNQLRAALADGAIEAFTLPDELG